MDESNQTRPHDLVAPRDDTQASKADLETGLQRMGLESVFDIARMTKTQFALELARHTDADAGQAYNDALGYARHISRLYQEHQLSSGDAKRRVRRSVGSDSTPEHATYQALFSENWEQFCKDGDIAAIDSPVAYLRALHLFVSQLETLSTQTGKITLETRRPDLKGLMLDQQSAFIPRPMLNIVNDTLSSHIAEHLTAINEQKSVNNVLASEHYPFSLPYDLHHHQCLLGLDSDKPTLGLLNYRISKKLPLSQEQSEYGQVFNEPSEAQKLLSGLSPEQQKILTGNAGVSALEKAYGTEEISQLSELEFFKERTGLTTEQVEQMLAQGRYGPRNASNSPTSEYLHYGSSYINGSISGQKSIMALKIAETEKSTPRITNSSNEHFARLHRMIRLQRWTGIPFAELDTLIVSALRSEGSDSATLNTNTLRTLGVYRYLNQRYGLLPEEFASFLHDLPTFASGERVPLFDQVFNRTRLLENPLKNDSPTLLDTHDLETFSYLSAGLGLPVTQDALLLLAQQTGKYGSSLKHDLPTVSSLYRQARIARMFGLSPLECTKLARLSGGDTFCKLLVTGTLRKPGTSTTDILDVLMAMDWAIDWLKQSNRGVAQLCRLFDTENNDLALNQNLASRLETFGAPLVPSVDQQQRHVESLLHDVAHLSAEYIPCVMIMADTTATAVFMDIRNSPGTVPPSLAKLLRAAEACLELHLSSSTLQQLLSHPTCLAKESLGRLTPHTLYLLERFSHCVHQQAQSEDTLLHYLRLAKPNNALLANLLNWTTEEVSCLTDALPSNQALSMEEVDWIMRCQACCKSTGLSTSLLLKATALKTGHGTAQDNSGDWKTVGEALIAARH